MTELYFIVLAIVVCFAFVLLYGAPYLPSTKLQIRTAFESLDLKEGQKFYELGCGDGKVMAYFASKGVICEGYELNPLLYLIARTRLFRYRKNASVHLANFWKVSLKDADGVYVFLLDRFMDKLDKKLSNELKKGVKLASFAFKIPNKKAQAEKSGIFIYKY